MLIDHNPSVPNRQRAVLADGEDPGAAIAQMGRRLENAGADFLVMVCNSAHAFVAELTSEVDIPLVSIVDVTASACRQFRVVGLLATDGCIASEAYQDALRANDVGVVLPTRAELVELMAVIGRLKAGEVLAADREIVLRITGSMLKRGAEAIVAGCTEIPLILDDVKLFVSVVDSTAELAKATVAAALR